MGADKAAFLARWDEISDALHAIVLSKNGSIAAEHGVGALKRQMLRRTKAPVDIALMEKLKAALDPQNILNPGKVI